MRASGVLVMALLVSAAACPGSEPSASESEAPREELTRRQKDSLVSTLPIAGSRGVARAIEAQDAAAERARILDEESRR